VNITNVNITNIYRNSQFRNGISAVAAHDFQSGRFNNVIRTSGSQVGSVGVVRGQMPFTAGSQNMRFSDRQATSIPRGNNNARFFTHQQPNPVQRSQFRGAASVPQASPQANRGGTVGQSTDSGWRRFGSPSGQSTGSQGNQPAVNRNGAAGTSQAQRNDRPSSSQQGGWQRFGNPSGRGAPSQSSPSASPRPDGRSGQNNQVRRFASPSGGTRQESLRIAPPVVRERPSYNAPRPSAPSYSAPRQSSPSFGAPRQSAPAPRNNGGGSPRGNGGGSAPRGNSGGGHSNRGR
jgi:hypothetical protein